MKVLWGPLPVRNTGEVSGHVKDTARLRKNSTFIVTATSVHKGTLIPAVFNAGE